MVTVQLDVGDHESPAEMETVKKILETVNANVTRQLLEASVQRVKNAGHNPADRERCYENANLNEGNIIVPPVVLMATLSSTSVFIQVWLLNWRRTSHRRPLGRRPVSRT